MENSKLYTTTDQAKNCELLGSVRDTLNAIFLLAVIRFNAAAESVKRERKELEYGNGATWFSATCNNMGGALRLLPRVHHILK